MIIRLGILSLDGLAPEKVIPALTNRVSGERQKRAMKAEDRWERLRSLAGSLLVEQMIREEGEFDQKFPLEMSYTPKGKPFLEEGIPYTFNLSHSGVLVACALGQEELGVDVQHFRGVRHHIVEGIFSPGEKEWIRKQEDGEKAFYQIWSLKESFAKAVGTGITLPLSRVSFQISEEIRVIQDVNPCFYHAGVYETGREYSLALVGREKIPTEYQRYVLSPDGEIVDMSREHG